MKQFFNSYEYLSHFKSRYKSNNNLHKIYLIEKIFKIKKTNMMSIDKYLIEMKKKIDIFKDIEVSFFKLVVVWYIISKLFSVYNITKHMILGDNKLLTYFKLNMNLFSEDLSKCVQKPIKKDIKSLISY